MKYWVIQTIYNKVQEKKIKERVSFRVPTCLQAKKKGRMFIIGKYEAVHPWVTSLGGLCKRDERQLTKEKRKKEGIISHLRQIKPSDLFSACINLSEKHYCTAMSFGGVQLHIYLIIYGCDTSWNSCPN